MAAIPCVPSSVPSDSHTSRPSSEVVAAKTRRSSMTRNSAGSEEPSPGSMSTSLVPASLPSLIHSSRPCVPSSATNTTDPPNAVSDWGRESVGPGRMSFTRKVPAVVPSVRQSSRPVSSLDATKNVSVPLETNSYGTRFNGKVLMSFTSAGVAADAALAHRKAVARMTPRTLASRRDRMEARGSEAVLLPTSSRHCRSRPWSVYALRRRAIVALNAAGAPVQRPVATTAVPVVTGRSARLEQSCASYARGPWHCSSLPSPPGSPTA
jgi:hypothetical protein